MGKEWISLPLVPHLRNKVQGTRYKVQGTRVGKIWIYIVKQNNSFLFSCPLLLVSCSSSKVQGARYKGQGTRVCKNWIYVVKQNNSFLAPCYLLLAPCYLLLAPCPLPLAPRPFFLLFTLFFMPFKSFEDILAWQKAGKLALHIYKEFSLCRDFGFKDQIQRASVSVPNNIAEGFERGSVRDFKKFLYIARGSCGEIRSMLILAFKLKYISASSFKELNSLSLEISRIIYGLIKKI